MKKRLLSAILLLCMVMRLGIPVCAEEADPSILNSYTEGKSVEIDTVLNPVYENVVKEEQLNFQIGERSPVVDGEKHFVYCKGMGHSLRVDMAYRRGLSINIYTEDKISSKAEWKDYLNSVINEACDYANMGIIYGDSIKWEFLGYKAKCLEYIPKKANGYYYYEVDLQIAYLSTPEQQNEVVNEINSLLAELGVNTQSISDYDKIKKVYAYICDNVKLDKEHDVKLACGYSDTDYSALIEKKASSIGIARLLYMMLRGANVDSRIVSGEVNGEYMAWNLVELDNKYYFLNAAKDNGTSDYQYFLKGKNDFSTDYIIDEKLFEEINDYRIFSTKYVNPENCEHIWSSTYTIDKEPTCSEEGEQNIYCLICDGKQEGSKQHIPTLSHTLRKREGKEATCEEQGQREYYQCDVCEKLFGDNEGNLEITLKDTIIEKKGHLLLQSGTIEEGYTQYSCATCGLTHIENSQGYANDVIRIYGADRYKTCYAIADVLQALYQEDTGNYRFDTVLVANGTKFPDALGGSYLACVKYAPIILTDGKNINPLKYYVQNHLNSWGEYRMLGGLNALSWDVAGALIGSNGLRLQGEDRYETNLKILEDAEVGEEPVLICTGKNFADSLSASATGKPIFLVGEKLTKAQKEFLKKHKNNKYYILGGTSAVSSSVEKDIQKIVGSDITRLAGKTRFETSLQIAHIFFENPDTAVITYAMNFPDGLSGGVLAYKLNAPLILATETGTTAAESFVDSSITKGIVLGGTQVLPDETVRKIFNLGSMDEIAEIKKE